MRINKYGQKFRPGVVTRLDGQRFGLLTVLHRAGNSGKFAAWLCRCDCGTELVVGGNRLRQGRKNRCNSPEHKIKRQPSVTIEYRSEYQSWSSMHERCRDKNHKGYANYGGRGIVVCERWNDFKAFMMDMGRKPDPKFVIERKDVDGNYEPTNCCWISRKDQGRNKRNSVFVTYQGKRILLLDLVEELGLSRQIVYERLKLGWTLAQAIALPVRITKPRGPHKKKPAKKKTLAICNDSIKHLFASKKESPNG